MLYCNAACQRAHWALHKKTCAGPATAADAERALSPYSLAAETGALFANVEYWTTPAGAPPLDEAAVTRASTAIVSVRPSVTLSLFSDTMGAWNGPQLMRVLSLKAGNVAAVSEGLSRFGLVACGSAYAGSLGAAERDRPALDAAGALLDGLFLLASGGGSVAEINALYENAYVTGARALARFKEPST